MPTWRRKPDGRLYADLRDLRDKLPAGASTRPTLLTPADIHAGDLRLTDDEAQRRFTALVKSITAEPAPDGGAGAAPAARRSAADNPTLHAIHDYYVQTYLPNRNAAPKSITKANQVTRDFSEWCADRRIGRIQQIGRRTADEFAAWLDAKGKSPKTIHNALGTLRACYNAAVDAELIAANPVRKWPMPRLDDPDIQIITPDEVAEVVRIIREWCPRIYPPVYWIALTGNPPSDTVALQWSQVDLDASFVRRTRIKTRRLMRYPIPPEAVALLRAQRRDSDLVFITDKGRPFDANRLTMTMQHWRKKAGFQKHIGLYTLRHSFCSHMLNIHNCPVQDVQVLMGHADIKTTMRYLHDQDPAPYVQAHGAALARQITQARVTPRHPKPKTSPKTRI